MEPTPNHLTDEKKKKISDVAATPEHRETIPEKHSPNGSDLESSGVFKGDDSDGKVF
jgi:hypothetical protein